MNDDNNTSLSLFLIGVILCFPFSPSINTSAFILRVFTALLAVKFPAASRAAFCRIGAQMFSLYRIR